MMIAQRLYEGIDLGGEEGTVGLITYMRTDSPQVSNDALAEVREFIGKDFGKEFLPESPNTYKSRKAAQEAHEAIRPTSVARHPDSVKQFLQEDDPIRGTPRHADVDDRRVAPMRAGENECFFRLGKFRKLADIR